MINSFYVRSLLPQQVDLYVGKEVVKRAIPNEQACDALVQLIKDNGRWQDPPVKEDNQINSNQKEKASI